MGTLIGKGEEVEKALRDLFSIVEIEGVDRDSALNARKTALKDWIDSYITHLTVENNVIKTNLDSEEEDFLKYHLGYQIAEKLVEDHATVISADNKVSVSVLVLGKVFPKNQE